MGLQLLEALVLTAAWLLIVTLVLLFVQSIRHLIKGPRCPDCNAWLLEIDGDLGNEVHYFCTGCGQNFWKRELEKHRER